MLSLKNELWLALRDRMVQATLAVAFILSTLSVIAGFAAVSEQQTLIEELERVVTEDRDYVLTQQSDAGGAAYYSYHFTYDEPSALAFAAQGVRSELPWKHRIRMVAVEGQIYEADTGTPELALAGQLDFTFVAAVLVPIFLIVLLHDLRASESRGRRLELLLATAQTSGLFRWRTTLRASLLFVAIVLPFLVGALLAGSPAGPTLAIVAGVAFNVSFWGLLCHFVASRLSSGPTVAATVLGAWFVLALVVPTGGKLLVESTVSVPDGGDILLTQREAVNDAWDLPKQATMEPFLERYPEWSPYAEVERPFEWKWYYAFQQVGDQTVEPLSQSLRAGVAKRDARMASVAFLSPTLLTERIATAAASTDVSAYQRYEACVRAFHAELRAFHYPMLFGVEPYSSEAMEALPKYRPCTGGDSNDG